MSKPKREIQRPRLKYKEGMSKDEIQKIAKAFGLRLREAREEKGKTQEELADAVGLKSAIVSMYERGERTPPWSTVLFLAKALKIDVAFFLTDGPTWHVLSTEQTETYIVERDLATQATLAGTGLIRQLGTRLPLRVMNEVYSKAHAEEMPDARMQKALQGICDGHRSAMENTIQTAPKSALKSLFSSFHGFMRTGDFRRILFMDPPYNQAACDPGEALRYLQSTLKLYIEYDYYFMIVRDQFVDELLQKHRLATYALVGTIGNKLAIRQIADFEIAWSSDRDVITKFNDVLEELKKRALRIRVEELEQCCGLLNQSLKRARIKSDRAWSDPDVQAKWRATIEAELQTSGPDWLQV